MAIATCFASTAEKQRALPADGLIADPIFSSTHAITIDAPPDRVWPWIAQMGAGRAGWYSWDRIDNGGAPSAQRLMDELQAVAVGDVMPAAPGAADAFVVAGVTPCHDLVLTAPDGLGGHAVVWEHNLIPLEGGRTRLLTRAQASARWLDLARAQPPLGHRRIFIERVYAVLARLPRPLLIGCATLGHRVMEARHLRGIKHRSTHGSAPFKTPTGKAAFLAAYDAAMATWPVPYETIEVTSRFGTTHVVACGPPHAPPLVLLHGYMATLTMWSPNIAAWSRDYRIYAIDVMGQPGRSRPATPIGNASDFMSWLTATLDALHLDCVFLAGMSFGGWLALNYAVVSPDRVQKLILLSPGGLQPMVRQFMLRAMLMAFIPSRLTVEWFFHWLGFTGLTNERMLDLMCLGLKHFQMAPETMRVEASMVSDEALRTMPVPTLLLIGEGEVICNPRRALERARRLIPGMEGDLVPACRHEMYSRQHEIVDARVLDFLKKTTGAHLPAADRSVA